MNDGDPTIVTKLLQDFNSKGAGVRLESPYAPFVTRLRFDDSNTDNVTPARKRKWDENHESKILLSCENEGGPADMSLDITQQPTESPWVNRRLKADLLEARAQISNLEMRVSQLHSLRKELEVVFEAEKESLLKQQERDRLVIQEMEAKISALRKKDFTFRDSIGESQRIELEKLQADKKIQALQKQNTELVLSLEEAKSIHQSTERDLNNQILELNHSQSVLQAELTREKDIVRHLEKRVKDLEEGKNKLETLEVQIQEYQQKFSEMESEKEAAREARELALQQQEKLLRFPELERECLRLNDDVAKLKEAVQKKIMLEEEVSLLRLRCTSSEEKEKWASKIENENSAYVSQLAEWQGVVRDFCPGSILPPAQAIRNLIKNLQDTELILTSAISEKESEANICRQMRQQGEATVKNLEGEITQLKSTVELLNNQLRRNNKKMALITGERNSYRVQLDLYEKDLTVSQSQQSQQAQSRITELEQFLQNYRELVERLESDLAAACGTGGQGGLAEQLRAARKRQEELESERDELMARCDTLELQMEHRVLKGDFNPAATRILHFKQNPTAIAQANVESELIILREENSRLKERVKILEEGDRDDVTRKVEHRVAVSNSKELQDLQEQVKSADLLNQRLKEYFKRTSQEFRDCVYQLFGWKVDRLQNKGTMFRLSSMYAESSSDHLLFQMGNDSSMTVIETEFSSTLEELINFHLTQQHSLPMFLSAVTMELFSRQTMSIVQPSTYDAITLD